MCVIKMNIVKLLMIILPISSVVCEDYDFTTYQDMDWDDTEQVWKEDGDITLTWTEAIEMMKMEEINHYKDIIEEKNKLGQDFMGPLQVWPMVYI